MTTKEMKMRRMTRPLAALASGSVGASAIMLIAGLMGLRLLVGIAFIAAVLLMLSAAALAFARLAIAVDRMLAGSARGCTAERSETSPEDPRR